MAFNNLDNGNVNMETNKNDITISNDKDIIEHPQYKIIVDILTKLSASGIIWNLHGNCFAASDMLSAMLIQSGVECTMVECQASIRIQQEDGTSFFNLVGYDNFSFNGQVDTHVVVVTKTEIPILIDLGISQYLSQDHPFIVEKVDNKDPDVLGNYIFDNYNIIYQTKRNIRFPSLHQKTFLERVNAEVQASGKIKTMTLLVYFVSAFTLFNFIANMAIIIF
jgi:hypothetical protein